MHSVQRVALANAIWRRSARSTATGENCVEVSDLRRVVAVRDSKDAAGPKLLLDRAAFGALLGAIRSGAHDL
ncbi:DUF397 domain-containing protein [Actinomadura sp. WMMB 499]|uniref:DUF397 domain-containing protein n=1 Tax=Actinomadura sp. WMMB 499 TaxID=1219491 RepID=UPI001246EC40|nr:DUF397 domain-containing protein [Actinomadura sp. WMMB 499]QFG23221.1 DUF397 domain-containing protein [Actinomadura sp. WMMB 499]